MGKFPYLKHPNTSCNYRGSILYRWSLHYVRKSATTIVFPIMFKGGGHALLHNETRKPDAGVLKNVSQIPKYRL